MLCALLRIWVDVPDYLLFHMDPRLHQDSEKMGVSSGTILFKGPPRLKPVYAFKAAIITMINITPPIINGSEFELFVLGKEVSSPV